MSNKQCDKCEKEATGLFDGVRPMCEDCAYCGYDAGELHPDYVPFMPASEIRKLVQAKALRPSWATEWLIYDTDTPDDEAAALTAEFGRPVQLGYMSEESAWMIDDDEAAEWGLVRCKKHEQCR